MENNSNLSDLSVGDSVIFQRQFSAGRSGKIHKVTDRYIYVELTSPDSGRRYVSCIKFRRADGQGVEGRRVHRYCKIRRPVQEQPSKQVG